MSSGPTRARPYHHGDLRNALLAAAVAAARTGGPDAVLLREVTRRVGVSPNAAYRHFAALSDLLEAVALVGQGELVASMQHEVAHRPKCSGSGPAEDAVEQMLAAGRGYVRFALREPGLFAAAFRRRQRPPLPAAGGGTAGSSPWTLLEEGLHALVDAGLLTERDLPVAATAAWANVHGLALLLLGPIATASADEQEHLVETTLAFTATALLARGGDPGVLPRGVGWVSAAGTCERRG